ncbi:MAG: hypothetical protein ABSG93_18880 [Solirubrobacteraceae bacterium]
MSVAASEIKLNLLRRHMDAVTWGEQFKRLAEARGVRLGSGKGDPSGKADTVSALSAELGVNARTAQRRIAAASLPEPEKQAIRDNKKTVTAALRDDKREKKRAAAKAGGG